MNLTPETKFSFDEMPIHSDWQNSSVRCAYLAPNFSKILLIWNAFSSNFASV